MPTEGLVRLPDELHPVGSLQRGCFGETGLGSSLQQQHKACASGSGSVCHEASAGFDEFDSSNFEASRSHAEQRLDWDGGGLKVP